MNLHKYLHDLYKNLFGQIGTYPVPTSIRQNIYYFNYLQIKIKSTDFNRFYNYLLYNFHEYLLFFFLN